LLTTEGHHKFKESFFHAPWELHAETFVLPLVRDDEHAHVDSSSDESFDSKDSYNLGTDSVQLDAESMHVYADA